MKQSDVMDVFSMGSPVKIEVTEVNNGATRDVNVVVKSIGNVPTGTYKLFTAVVEDPRNYATAPGSNGETHFPNVFRKMYPNINGENITPAAIGSSVSFNYTINIDANWVAANVKVVCFLQNMNTKEILNVGTVSDPIINYSISTPSTEVNNAASGVLTSFNLTTGNTGSTNEDFIYTLTNNAPADWSSNFVIDGNTFTNTATVTANAGNTSNLLINVTPGATRGIASYTISVKAANTPNLPAMVKTVYVISGVTDLIVNNSGYVGDGVTAGSAANWDSVYTKGLIAAYNQGYASANEIMMRKAMFNGAFTGIKNIYYNAGWTFPGITDEVAQALQEFMLLGGNLFIAGQDLGWEINDTAASDFDSPIKRAFYKNFLHATFVVDGGTTNSALTTVTADSIFGNIANAPINNFYGGAYFYPDQINVADSFATPIFKYANGTSIGGIRAQTANYKVVYIAPGMEMLNPTNASQIIKRAHDWFYGLIATSALQELSGLHVGMGQNYPNPSIGFTSIAFENLNENMNFELIDITGKVVMSKQITKGTNKLDINTTNYNAGKYLYRLTDSNGHSLNKSMMIK